MLGMILRSLNAKHVGNRTKSMAVETRNKANRTSSLD